MKSKSFHKSIKIKPVCENEISFLSKVNQINEKNNISAYNSFVFARVHNI